ncbi:MAG: hypothetical protein IKN24_04365 [Lachnospiraceae bacterium]|nr:hypothetical protein [Lachnospiraceae bacterium]
MAEKIYAIPVNDAFDKDCECPVCQMYSQLEADAISFTLGPSYMDDRFRLQTDKLGFCTHHMQMLYDKENRLGLALMMKTHMEKTNKEIEALSKNPLKGGLFKKSSSALIDYVKELESTCFVCGRIDDLFARYIYTVHYLYRNDEKFRDKYKNCKGFCTRHFGMLLEGAPKELSGKLLDEFNSVTVKVYLDNMKRVEDDVQWFINKFDYNYKDEPWKEAKTAVIRAMNKLNGIIPPQEKKTGKLYD